MDTFEKNMVWKYIIIISILFFGIFIYFYLLQNRKNDSQMSLESSDNDQENISSDWRNVFHDLSISFKKINAQP